MTKKTRRKIDVAPRSVAIASTISGSLSRTITLVCCDGAKLPMVMVVA